MLTSVQNVCVVTTFYTLESMKSILLPKFVFFRSRLRLSLKNTNLSFYWFICFLWGVALRIITYPPPSRREACPQRFFPYQEEGWSPCPPKTSILWCSAFFMDKSSHPYMTTGNTIAFTRWTFVGKVISLLFNMLSRLVINGNPLQYSCLENPMDGGAW